MSDDKDHQMHYLGEESSEGSTNRFFLVTSDRHPYRVLLEKKGDPADTCELEPNQFQGHFVNEVPLANVVLRKFAELGLTPEPD